MTIHGVLTGHNKSNPECHRIPVTCTPVVNIYGDSIKKDSFLHFCFKFAHFWLNILHGGILPLTTLAYCWHQKISDVPTCWVGVLTEKYKVCLKLGVLGLEVAARFEDVRITSVRQRQKWEPGEWGWVRWRRVTHSEWMGGEWGGEGRWEAGGVSRESAPLRSRVSQSPPFDSTHYCPIVKELVVVKARSRGCRPHLGHDLLRGGQLLSSRCASRQLDQPQGGEGGEEWKHSKHQGSAGEVPEVWQPCVSQSDKEE